jgi:hypothetical protein
MGILLRVTLILLTLYSLLIGASAFIASSLPSPVVNMLLVRIGDEYCVIEVWDTLRHIGLRLVDRRAFVDLPAGDVPAYEHIAAEASAADPFFLRRVNVVEALSTLRGCTIP